VHWEDDVWYGFTDFIFCELNIKEDFFVMSTIEKIDVNKVKISFSVDAARFEEGLKYSYNKNKGSISIPGFRKGKAPRKLIEAQYGKGVFYDDAINYVLPNAYESAVKENELDVVSKPEIDITSIDENGVSFTAEVYTRPEVKIEGYKGLTCKKADTEVSDDEVEAEIKKELSKNARIIEVTDRAVQSGDIVTIDFKGFMDGEAFAGGEAQDYDLEIGSHSFIDTFEDQLIGKNIDEDVKVNVTFPEEYGQADLAGKPAVFEVKVKGIKFKELPELTDEYVADTTDSENVADYKNDIVGRLKVTKMEAAKSAKQEELLTKLIDMAEMDVPAPMIELDIDNKVHEFEYNITRQGLSLEMYLQYMGQTMESMRDAYRPMSEKQVKGRLVLEAVAANEGFEITDEEITAEIERIAKNYNMPVENLTSAISDDDKKNIVKDLQVQKAIAFVCDNAVESDEA
jgi:trigger factor